jgi:hypothetical protein
MFYLTDFCKSLIEMFYLTDFCKSLFFCTWGRRGEQQFKLTHSPQLIETPLVL